MPIATINPATGETLKTFVPLSDAEIEDSLTETGSWEGNLTQTTHSGRELIVASRLAVKAGGNAILEINRDITAQLQAEDALRKAERLAAIMGQPLRLSLD